MSGDAGEIVTCSKCGSQVKRSFLKRHDLRQHGRKTEKKIMCCVCKEHFSFRQKFRDHVSENHGQIESKKFKFRSVEDFTTWLRTEEKQNKIRFIKIRQPSKLSNGNTRDNYYCQYDNAVDVKIKPQDERKRALKYQVSYKLSGCCPAEIIVEVSKRTGSVSVVYYSSHLGHNNPMKLIQVEARYIVRQINAAHRSSCEINDEDISEKDSYFEVKAQSDSDKFYIVKREYEICPYSCDVTCKPCDTCQHTYSCTCVSYSIQTRMCKHIHKVCSYIRSKNIVSIALQSICEEETVVDDELNIIQSMPSTPSKEEDLTTNKTRSMIEEWKNYAEKVTTLLESGQTPICGVEKLINEAKKFLFKNQQRSRAPVPVEKSLSPASKKIDHQRRLNSKHDGNTIVSRKLFSTRRKKVDIRELAIKKPTQAQKNILRQHSNTSPENQRLFLNISNTFDHIFN